MKMTARILLFFIMTQVFSSCACLRPIGKCTYKDHAPQKGEVTIVSIEEKKYGRNSLYLVRVKGFYNRTFRMTPAKYNACIAEKGLKEGSKINGYIHEGGPCPPIFFLERCR